MNPAIGYWTFLVGYWLFDNIVTERVGYFPAKNLRAKANLLYCIGNMII